MKAGEAVVLRQEEPCDHPAVEALVEAAFRLAEHRDGNEARLVAALRRNPRFVPALSIVAELDGRVVGHVLLTPVDVVRAGGPSVEVLALAPVSVAPSHQGRGLGGALVHRAHAVAAGLGHRAVVLLGHPAYYPRFGYVPASRFGIRAPFDVPDEAFMAIALAPGALRDCAGTVRYPPEFGLG